MISNVKPKAFFAIILILVTSLSAGLTYWYAQSISAPSIGATIEPGSLSEGCTFTLYQDGSTILAKNGNTGANDYSGTNVVTILNTIVGLTAIKTGAKLCFLSGVYNFASQLTVKTHGLFFEALGFQREAGDQPTASPAPAPVIFKATATITAIIQWGDNTSGVVWNSGGIRGIEFDCDAKANYAVINYNTHDFRAIDNTMQNCLTWQLAFDATLAGGISNVYVQRNLFRIINQPGQGTGGGVFFDSGVGQSWIAENYFSNLLDKSILDQGTNQNHITNNYIETTRRVSVSPPAFSGTAIYVSGPNMEAIQNNIIYIADYHGILLGSKAENIISGNIIVNVNTSNLADGACIYLENPQWNNVIADNDCFDDRNASKKIVYGVNVNVDVGSLKISITGNTIHNVTTSGIRLGNSVPANSTLIRNNFGYNPVGSITNPLSATTCTSATTCSIGLRGSTATAAASKDYVVAGVDVFITSTGGTAVSIVIKDNSGNTVWSPGATLSGYFLPVGYRINFGAFSGAPTVTVFGN